MHSMFSHGAVQISAVQAYSCLYSIRIACLYICKWRGENTFLTTCIPKSRFFADFYYFFSAQRVFMGE